MKKKIFFDFLFFASLIMIVFFKLWLIRDQEIAAICSLHDEYWHILTARDGYWNMDGYSQMRFIHLPMMSWWVWLCAGFGLPLRLATEGLFLGSAGVMLYAVSLLGIKRLWQVVLFFLIALNPYSIGVFDRATPDALSAVLTLSSTAIMLILWGQRDACGAWKLGALVGFLFTAACLTRKESGVILLALFLWMFIASVYLWLIHKKWLQVFRWLLIAGLIPLGIVFLGITTFKTINYFKFGIFASTEMTASGYAAAYRSLLRIKPDKPVRFVPVTHDVREKAYSVSQAFSELKPYFDGEKSRMWFAETRRVMGIDEEIAAGWFYWALRDAAADAGHYKTPVSAEAFYNKVATEINRAIDNNRISGRSVFSNFLDPDFRNYVPYFGESCRKLWKIIVSGNIPYPIISDQPGIPKDAIETFDRMASRRAGAIRPGGGDISGWAVSMAGQIKSVELLDENGNLISATNVLFSRPDVEKNVAAFNGYSAVGFNFRENFGRFRSVKTVRFEFADKKNFSCPIAADALRMLDRVGNVQKTDYVFLHMDTVGTQGKKIGSVRMIAFELIVKIEALVFKIGIWIGLLLICVLFFRKTASMELLMPLILLFLVAVFRFSFVALLDASSWPGEVRYLFPVLPILSTMIVVMFSQGERFFCAQFFNKA